MEGRGGSPQTLRLRVEVPPRTQAFGDIPLTVSATAIPEGT